MSENDKKMSEQTLKLRVVNRQDQGHDVLVADLVRADGADLPPFEAGAHVDLLLPGGIVRQYSLAGNPAERGRYRLGILKDPASRGGSLAAHTALVDGAEVEVGLPRNHFPLAMEAARTVLLGGGIGITPMIAMAWALHNAGKPFELHYCSRSRSASAFLDELAASPFADQVHLHFDDEAPEQRLDLNAVLAGEHSGTHVYTCGPTGFMEWVIAEAKRLGIADARIHKEYFQATVDSHGNSFEVVAKKSGKTVQVADGQSIVAALATVGIKIKVSCEQGVCGTCLCTVLEGEPDHRDAFLTDEEKADNDQILLCCSRAKSDRLVLDL